jgi:hypothetical protein
VGEERREAREGWVDRRREVGAEGFTDESDEKECKVIIGDMNVLQSCDMTAYFSYDGHKEHRVINRLRWT